MPMTPEETNTLEAVKKKFETNAKGKAQNMSGIEKDVYAALSAQFELDGQTSQKTMEKIIDDTVKKAIEDVRAGRRTMQDISRIARPKGLVGKIKNTVDDVVNELKNPEDIRKSIDTDALVTLGKDNGLPEKDEKEKPATIIKPATTTDSKTTAGSVEEFLVNAAKNNPDGNNKALENSELKTLVNDAKFIAAAKKLTGSEKVTITVNNNTENTLDAIIIKGDKGTKVITLSNIDSEMRFASDVASGELQIPVVGKPPTAPKTRN